MNSGADAPTEDGLNGIVIVVLLHRTTPPELGRTKLFPFVLTSLTLSRVHC